MNIHSYLPSVEAYLHKIDLAVLPGWQAESAWVVLPLAQGEYNMNYLLQQGELRWVVRVNIGTQIGCADQILYEFETLERLAGAGFTPRPYFLDDSKTLLAYGVLMMEYLEGDALVYPRDYKDAARLFAGIHTYSHEFRDHTQWIKEQNPLSMTFEECSQLLKVYFESSAADPKVCDYLQVVIDWADEARLCEVYFQESPWWCVINTEVNSSNFILNREQGSIHLVDWEKPLWGDPSQDLSHFSVPTTTLWKTSFRMSREVRQKFLDVYRREVNDPFLADTIVDRVNLRDPFNCLRGVSWCAMAWVKYRSGEHALQNADTFAKLDMYVDIDFLHSVFEPVLEGNGC